MQESYPKGYHIVDSVDLRAFDNRLPDFGVKNYIERLGFVPNIITLLECSVEQVHTHNGVIDNTTVPYIYCSERAMPGGNVWSKRQLSGLVDEIHKAGSKFYFGCLSLPNKFDEYETRMDWVYENLDLFIVHSDGTSQREKRGGINVLRRLPDGSYYEDYFIRDLLRYLKDYDMDGFYAGDGWCGLWTPLWMGDYHPDMIDQFERHSGIKVQGNTVAEQASFIWEDEEHRAAWIQFYSDRWTAFYQKLNDALKAQGKGLVTIDPWATGPAEALYTYGIDYRRLAKTGIDGLCLQAREENWGRRGAEWFYVWEPGEIASIGAIRAQAPELPLYWAICTCNAPEHWIATKDVMNCLERQSLSLPSVCYVDENGEYQRALEGLQFIFGTDVEQEDYRRLSQCWDMSFNMPIKRMLGPALVWSDNAHLAKVQHGQRYDIISQALYFIFSGLPVHAAVNTCNLPVAKCDAYLLINPEGYSDAEVDQLLEKLSQGKHLIVSGDVSHPKLLEALGLTVQESSRPEKFCLEKADIPRELERFENIWKGNLHETLDLFAMHNWTYEYKHTDSVIPNPEIDRCCYVSTDAQVILAADTDVGKRVIMSFKEHPGAGKAIYIARAHRWPNDLYARGKFFNMYNIWKALPDEMDLFLSSCISWLTGQEVAVNKGQLFAFETQDNKIHLGLGNCGNLFYNDPTVSTNKELIYLNDYPIKRYTPAGVIHFDAGPHSFKVTVPPDGCEPIQIRLKQD